MSNTFKKLSDEIVLQTLPRWYKENPQATYFTEYAALLHDLGVRPLLPAEERKIARENKTSIFSEDKMISETSIYNRVAKLQDNPQPKVRAFARKFCPLLKVKGAETEAKDASELLSILAEFDESELIDVSEQNAPKVEAYQARKLRKAQEKAEGKEKEKGKKKSEVAANQSVVANAIAAMDDDDDNG